MHTEKQGSELVAVEVACLTNLEEVIERGLHTFVEVGEALREIRDRRLYRQTHSTFKAYCDERWGFSDSRGRQLIAAAKTVTDVTVAGLPAPRTEGEARRLSHALRRADDLDQHHLVRGRLPDIEGEAWESFAEDIRAHGLLDPIVLHEGMVLDGWQRLRACRETMIAPIFTEYEGDEPLSYWYSVNLIRHHAEAIAA